MIAPLFSGRVQDGKIHLADPIAWRALLHRMEGKEIDLRLTKHRRVRSLSQNAFYHGVVVSMLAEHCGYENSEMHDALKMRFLRSHEDGPIPSVRSTADLDTAEFAKYLDSCIRLCAELGICVPDPGAVG